jgi:sec-independent protein translocase protein TatB
LFDLSFPKIAILIVIALIVFGPDQLPKMAAQAGRALRDVRRLAEGAKADLQEHLGPEFSDFDINELNPKYFVRKHLLEDDATGGAGGADVTAADLDGNSFISLLGEPALRRRGHLRLIWSDGRQAQLPAREAA